MKKKLVSFVCAVMVALCLAVSVPVQAYAATEDEIAPQYTGISEISADLYFENGVAYCRGTTRAYANYTVKLVMVLKRSNVEYVRWEDKEAISCIVVVNQLGRLQALFPIRSAATAVTTDTAETALQS